MGGATVSCRSLTCLNQSTDFPVCGFMKLHSPITTEYWIIRATLCSWPSSSWIFTFSASSLSWFWLDFPLTQQKRALTPTHGQRKMLRTCEKRRHWKVHNSLQSLRMYACVCDDLSLLLWLLFSVPVHKQLRVSLMVTLSRERIRRMRQQLPSNCYSQYDPHYQDESII